MNSNQDTSHLSDERARKLSEDPNFFVPRQVTLCESLIYLGKEPEKAFQEAKRIILHPQKSYDE